MVAVKEGLIEAGEQHSRQVSGSLNSASSIAAQAAVAYVEDGTLRTICDAAGMCSREEFLQHRKNITSLDIFNVSLSHMPSLQWFPHLVHLQMIHQDIREIRGLETLRNLEGLWLSENAISRIEGLEHCTNLRQLYLNGNALSRIDHVAQLTQLEILWVTGNRLHTLRGIDQVPSLRVLYAGQNYLETLGDYLRHLFKLEELNLAGNRLWRLKDLTLLGSLLPSLRSLTLNDPLYGSNPVCNVGNYHTYTLYHVRSLQTLDAAPILREQRQVAEMTFFKKAIYYNMRAQTARRTTRRLSQVLEAYIARQVQDVVKGLQLLLRCTVTMRGRGEVRNHNVLNVAASLNPSTTNSGGGQCISALARVEYLAMLRKRDVERLERMLADVQRLLYRNTELFVDHLMLELHSGGNVRYEEGSHKDAWCHSCIELVRARFAPQDYAPFGITDLKVTRVVRAYNNLLRTRFEDRIAQLVDVSDVSHRNALEYLFFVIPSNAKKSVFSYLEEGIDSGYLLMTQTPVPQPPPQVAHQACDSTTVSSVSDNTYTQSTPTTPAPLLPPSNVSIPPPSGGDVQLRMYPLTNSVFLAEEDRLIRNKSAFSGSVDLDGVLRGHLLVCKVFLGKSLPETASKREGSSEGNPASPSRGSLHASSYTRPLVTSGPPVQRRTCPDVPLVTVYRTDAKDEGRHRVWYNTDAKIVLPEYLVEFLYTNASIENLRSLPSPSDPPPSRFPSDGITQQRTKPQSQQSGGRGALRPVSTEMHTSQAALSLHRWNQGANGDDSSQYQSPLACPLPLGMEYAISNVTYLLSIMDTYEGNTRCHHASGAQLYHHSSTKTLTKPNGSDSTQVLGLSAHQGLATHYGPVAHYIQNLLQRRAATMHLHDEQTVYAAIDAVCADPSLVTPAAANTVVNMLRNEGDLPMWQSARRSMYRGKMGGRTASEEGAVIEIGNETSGEEKSVGEGRLREFLMYFSNLEAHFTNGLHLASRGEEAQDEIVDARTFVEGAMQLNLTGLGCMLNPGCHSPGSVGVRKSSFPNVRTLLQQAMSTLIESARPNVTLMNLTHLSLPFSHVSGPLPDVFLSLVALELLDVSYNAISSLPSDLSAWHQLTTLDLRCNHLWDVASIASTFASNLYPPRLTALWMCSNNTPLMQRKYPKLCDRILHAVRALKELDGQKVWERPTSGSHPNHAPLPGTIPRTPSASTQITTEVTRSVLLYGRVKSTANPSGTWNPSGCGVNHVSDALDENTSNQSLRVLRHVNLSDTHLIELNTALSDFLSGVHVLTLDARDGMIFRTPGLFLSTPYIPCASDVIVAQPMHYPLLENTLPYTLEELNLSDNLLRSIHDVFSMYNRTDENSTQNDSEVGSEQRSQQSCGQEPTLHLSETKNPATVHSITFEKRPTDSTTACIDVKDGVVSAKKEDNSPTASALSNEVSTSCLAFTESGMQLLADTVNNLPSSSLSGTIPSSQRPQHPPWSRLLRLYLSYNLISSLDGLARHCRNLLQLSIEGNELHSLCGIQHLPMLVELYASHNRIANIKEINYLRETTRLVVLDLAYNPIVHVQEYRLYAVYHIRQLKVLDGISVDPTELQTAKETFSGRMTLELLLERTNHQPIPTVRELNLSHCSLKEVALLQEYTALQHLRLDHNTLTECSGLSCCTNLVSLNLAFNRLGVGHLSGASGASSHLSSSCLSPSSVHANSAPHHINQNKACTLGRALAPLVHLESMSLEGNQINSLSVLGLNLPSLKFLNLKNNEIVKVEGLDRLCDLRELILDRNKIRAFDTNSFCNNIYLTELHCEENALKSLEGLRPLLYLSRLFASNNRIVELTELEHLEGLEHLTEVHLQGNALVRKTLYRPMMILRLARIHILDGREIPNEEKARTFHFYGQGEMVPSCVAQVHPNVFFDQRPTATAAPQQFITGSLSNAMSSVTLNPAFSNAFPHPPNSSVAGSGPPPAHLNNPGGPNGNHAYYHHPPINPNNTVGLIMMAGYLRDTIGAVSSHHNNTGTAALPPARQPIALYPSSGEAMSAQPGSNATHASSPGWNNLVAGSAPQRNQVGVALPVSTGYPNGLVPSGGIFSLLTSNTGPTTGVMAGSPSHALRTTGGPSTNSLGRHAHSLPHPHPTGEPSYSPSGAHANGTQQQQPHASSAMSQGTMTPTAAAWQGRQQVGNEGSHHHSTVVGVSANGSHPVAVVRGRNKASSYTLSNSGVPSGPAVLRKK